MKDLKIQYWLCYQLHLLLLWGCIGLGCTPTTKAKMQQEKIALQQYLKQFNPDFKGLIACKITHILIFPANSCESCSRALLGLLKEMTKKSTFQGIMVTESKKSYHILLEEQGIPADKILLDDKLVANRAGILNGIPKLYIFNNCELVKVTELTGNINSAETEANLP
ncbi:MAG TPA: hypothetical protein DCM08_00735 [Microscillaceae bacterium]|nr:hypothetical protein [Microscillaceae bacterium]